MIELIADLLWGLIEFLCWRERDKPADDARRRQDPRDAARARHDSLNG